MEEMKKLCSPRYGAFSVIKNRILFEKSGLEITQANICIAIK